MKNFDKLWENYDYRGKLEWEVAEDFYIFALEWVLEQGNKSYWVNELSDVIKKELGES
jgi:hypothetical protein